MFLNWRYQNIKVWSVGVVVVQFKVTSCPSWMVINLSPSRDNCAEGTKQN